MHLPGPLYATLAAALRDAFDGAELRDLVRTGLDVNLAEVAPTEKNLTEQVNELLSWAERAERVPELLACARAERPHSRTLQAAIAQYDAWAADGDPPAAQGRVPQPPPPPDDLVGRDRFLDDLAAELPTTARLALRGPAGMGKTALALALANHPAVAAAFPHGRAWVALGPQPDLFAALGSVLDDFGLDAGQIDSVAGRAALLRRMAAGRRWLLVVDDVWHTIDAQPLLDACGDGACALITTRSAQIADDLRAANHELYPLQPHAAVAMLAGAGADARRAVAADPAGAARLA
ncbi:MAG: hypothetical protein KDE01_31335, partial [Caldilineaceae bacterium]|nr:hypothetical protein [Caldilineaceae bacterium]